jgi:hypothetical protein
MASDKTTKAIDRMNRWLRENGGRCTPEFVADLTTLIEAAKGEQRQELVRRFAVALVGSEWYYKFRDGKFNAEHVWRTASELADAEPPSNT